MNFSIKYMIHSHGMMKKSTISQIRVVFVSLKALLDMTHHGNSVNCSQATIGHKTIMERD